MILFQAPPPVKTPPTSDAKLNARAISSRRNRNYRGHLEIDQGGDTAKYDYRLVLSKPKSHGKEKGSLPEDSYLARFLDLHYESLGIKKNVALFCEAPISIGKYGFPEPLSVVGEVMLPLLGFYLPSESHTLGAFVALTPVLLDNEWTFSGKVKVSDPSEDQEVVEIDGEMTSAAGAKRHFNSLASVDRKSGWPRSLEGSIAGPDRNVTFSMKG